ncbi:PilC/PilY family type IV pilus protein, partial [Candidatus Pelagibacter sp.]|nr:PilC/PilY family type IV pilus protein [Candidatus Pelagibacter sp.]
MTIPAGTFGKTFGMRAPYAAVYDPVAGNYWVAEEFEAGLTRWDQDQDPSINQKLDYSIWSTTNALGGDCPTSERKSRFIVNPIQIETWNGLIFTANSIPQNPDKGKVKTFNPLIQQKKDEVVAASNNGRNPDPNIIKCSERIADFDMKSSHIAIDIQDNILYAMGGGKADVTTGSYVRGQHFFWIRDLSKTGGNSGIKLGNWLDHTTRACTRSSFNFASGRTDGGIPNNRPLRTASKLLTAIAVDKNHQYLYVTNEYGKIYSFKLHKNGSDVCINPKHAPIASFTNPCGISHGLVTDPDDPDILYATGYESHQICKITLSNGSLDSFIVKGVENLSAPQSIDAEPYLMQPQSIKFDRDINGEKNLIVANTGRMEVIIVNRDLKFKKAFGLEGVSRLRGAMESIKAVVTDSTLTAGANFGLGLWSGGTNSKYIGWNNSKDRSQYCDEVNCMPVRVSADGAAKIYEYFKKPPSLYPQTHANAFSKMSRDYFNHADSPQDTSISCQSNYIIVIGDGGWNTGHNEAKSHLTTLANNNVKTIMIAYGDTMPQSAMDKFNEMAVAGGSDYTTAFVALSAQDLKTQLQSIIATITSENLAYTAPAISGSVGDEGKVFQMQFDYYASKEWEGSLKRSAINGSQVDTNYDWEASDLLPSPGSRKIWTSLKGLNDDLNNFIDTNSDLINLNLFQLTGNAVPDYHNDSGSVNGIGRCGSSGYNIATVEDGDGDDAKGLINFIRGQDYFDYDGDCNLAETRDHYLADIYNSQVLVVGPPNADTASLNENQEAFFRYKNNYDTFASQNSTRKKVIYAGANNGILHAFDADTGIEIWGFVPPLIASKLPTMINSGFNKTSGGGTVPIFGVDGSPVVHDVFMKKPGGTSKEWLSILMVPYGRGGAGFSVLDVTDPNNPDHLYSILNDRIRGYVYRSDHQGEIFPYSYGGRSFNINDFTEIMTVKNNYRNNSTIGDNCNQVASHACYKHNVLTLSNVNNYSTGSAIKIYVNGDDVTSKSTFSRITNTNKFKITLPSNISYSADPLSTVINSTVNVSIT